MLESKPLASYFSFYAEEFLFWQQKNLSQEELLQTLFNLHNSDKYLFLLKIDRNTVQVLDKKNMPEHPVYLYRANLYRNLIAKAVAVYPISGTTIIGLYSADCETTGYDLPIFSFQKIAGNHGFLLPDIDFLHCGFYKGDNFHVIETDFQNKKNSAVFVGSTTGGPIPFNKEMLLNNLVPRIKSALYFKNKQDVDFSLPFIVQYSGNATYQYLKDLGFGSGENVSYQEQFGHKFMISMDGNGATCSRVALTLKSNSVLLKYDSSNILFYFKKLIPWFHYIPIQSDEDVLTVIEAEKKHPGIFAPIVENAQRFYEDSLTEEALVGYTASLLHSYLNDIFLTSRNIAQEQRFLGWSGSNPALFSQVGDVQNEAIQSTGKAGVLLYGPYVSLAAGNYQVTLYGTVSDSTGIVIDAVIYSSTITLAHMELNQALSENCLTKFEIASDIPFYRLEVRVFVKQQSCIKVTRLEIVPIDKQVINDTSNLHAPIERAL